VEAFVYPKVVKGERVVSLGVRTASKIRSVKATFDFASEPIALTSRDGLSWSCAYRVPEGVAEGVHVARYRISGQKGNIQRTVEFFVEKSENPTIVGKGGAVASDVSEGEVLQSSGWHLTVMSTCTAYVGDSSRILYSGQVLTGISKIPFYKVIFDDGKEGWVLAVNVKEPTEDYYLVAYDAYKNGNYAAAVKYYRNAVNVDPKFIKGYRWLAKSYAAKGELEAASEAIQKALRLDERDIESRVVATMLAQKYFALGNEKYAAGRYNEAIASFRSALDLKPASNLSWIKMGESFRQLGLESEARVAWKEGLRYDPENAELRALLGAEKAPVSLASKPGVAAPVAKPAVAPLVADDSLQILKEEKTGKGTKIEQAIKSVVSLTRSLGTPIMEKGWQVKKQGEEFLVSYICEQSGGVLETFDWLVDVDTRRALPHNDNARLLMSRW